MTDDDLDRHLLEVQKHLLNFQWSTSRIDWTNARDRLRLAVDAARREGAEEMRERCVVECEMWTAPAENGIVFTAHAKYVHKTNAECAAAIRALPTGATS